MSTIQPPSGRASITALVEVCRPRPVTALTSPVSRAAQGHQRVDQRRLAHPAVPEEHAGAPREPVGQGGDVLPVGVQVARHDVGHPERRGSSRAVPPDRRGRPWSGTAGGPSRRRTPRPGRGRSAGSAARGRRGRRRRRAGRRWPRPRAPPGRRRRRYGAAPSRVRRRARSGPGCPRRPRCRPPTGPGRRPRRPCVPAVATSSRARGGPRGRGHRAGRCSGRGRR